MDFIEQWFGISPDGGSGVTEALWVVAIMAVVGVVLYRGRVLAWISSRRSRRR